MTGVVEEGAKIAGTFMDSLKREPLSLALPCLCKWHCSRRFT